MGFRNYEWMHQDRSGLDLGGFGLRLRPIDMQKFGVLYLSGGLWRGRPLISRRWVERSFSPWNRSRPASRDPDYGWFWWTYPNGSSWTTHAAIGWKGQRIAVLLRQRVVVTMTGQHRRWWRERRLQRPRRSLRAPVRAQRRTTAP
jgi:CubicO group peptidase (beta-lactamase class C family)